MTVFLICSAPRLCWCFRIDGNGTDGCLCHLLTSADGLPCSGAEVHFIPQQRRQWGPRASAETLQNGSGMQSWSRSMCWWRRHAPWSLPPTLHHQHGFLALQKQGPCPLTRSWPKLDTDPAPRLLRSVFGNSLHWCTPSQGDWSWQRRAGVHRLTMSCCSARKAASTFYPRTFSGQAEDARSAFPDSHKRKLGRSKSV